MDVGYAYRADCGTRGLCGKLGKSEGTGSWTEKGAWGSYRNCGDSDMGLVFVRIVSSPSNHNPTDKASVHPGIVFQISIPYLVLAFAVIH